MDGIFISYRRDDSAGYAGRLYDRLIPHFGAQRVFMDVEGIELGTDFVAAIEEAVGSCRVLIVIIGDEWLKTTDAAGRRRLEDPHDFIRLETVTALQRGIRVVPVLVGGAFMPRADELPDDLKPLARRQAIEISHKQWDATTAELIRALEAILSPDGAATDPAPRGAALRLTPATPPPAPPPDGGEAGTGGNPRRWPLTVSALLVATALVGGGLWAVLGPRDTGTQPQAKSESLQTAKAPAGSTSLAARPSAPPNVVVAAGPSPKTATPAAAPPPPVALVAPAPAPAVPEVPVAPSIRTFQSIAEVGGTRLCYSVADADSVLITPGPGEMHYRIKHCVRVEIDGPTTFTLTARNAVKSVSKSLKAAPKAPAPPEAVAVAPVSPPVAAPPPPVARAEPAATAANGVAPRVGESWTYRTSGKWPTSPKRSIVIAVQSVANGVVTDGMRAEGIASDVRRSTGAKPMFMSWNEIGTEFSPYLAAYTDMNSLGTLRGFATPDVQPNWSQWYSEGKLIGQETVSVPAGSFQAHKVEVWSSRHATGGPTQAGIEPVRIHYLIWYAPQTKRYVKMQRRVISASGTESEKDVFELMAYR
jgi:hypothetical protein